MADNCTYFDYRKTGEVATITLNNPDKLNAFNLAMLFEFRRIVDDLRIDLTTRFVILTGTGRAFCAGIDVTEKARQDWYADPHQPNDEEHGADHVEQGNRGAIPKRWIEGVIEGRDSLPELL